MGDKTKSQIGKSARKKGKQFEADVYKHLKERGWFITKWGNQVQFDKVSGFGSIVPAKSQYNPFLKRIVGEGSGFPDYLCFNSDKEMIWVECKSNGYLDVLEHKKAYWLIQNTPVNKFYTACIGKRKSKVVFKKFDIEKYKKKVGVR